MVQFTGIALASATFISIWLGHVGVRWLEARSVRIGPPMAVLIVGGIALNGVSLLLPSIALSGVCSIVGVTLLWDAYELVRQQKRVVKGHAPANPANPRHAAILAASAAATTEHLLDRMPLGHADAASAPQRAGQHAKKEALR